MHVLYLPRGRWIPTTDSRSRARSAAGIHAQTTPTTFPWRQSSSKHKWEENPSNHRKTPQITVLSRVQFWGNKPIKGFSNTYTNTQGLDSTCSGLPLALSIPLRGIKDSPYQRAWLCRAGEMRAGTLCQHGTGTASQDTKDHWLSPSSGSPSAPSLAAGNGRHCPTCTADQPTRTWLPAQAAHWFYRKTSFLCAFPPAGLWGSWCPHWASLEEMPCSRQCHGGLRPPLERGHGHSHSHRVWPPEQQPATARQATTKPQGHKSLLWAFGDTETGTWIAPGSPAAFKKCSTHL